MLTKIHHVGVVVQSADEALKFYGAALGLPVSDDRIIEDQGVRGVLLKVGDSEIELLEPTRDDTGVARFLQSRGEGMHHICFESDDVGKELEAAAAKGIELIDKAPRPGLAGMIGFLHPKSNQGVLVEFATPPGGHHEPEQPAGGVGATHIDHVVISSNDAAATAKLFTDNYGIEIKRVMTRPGSGAHMEFAKLREVILEFAGPGEPNAADGVKASLSGIVVAVEDMKKAVDAVRAAGFEVEEPHKAVQPGAVFAAVTSGSHGMPFGFIQYNAEGA